MPHATIDYSGNIETEVRTAGIVDIVHGVLIDSGLFQPQDIKTRAYASDDFMVGEAGQDGTFVHIDIAILEGRSTEQKATLNQSILDAIAPALQNVDSITVDTRDIVKACYRKTSTKA